MLQRRDIIELPSIYPHLARNLWQLILCSAFPALAVILLYYLIELQVSSNVCYMHMVCSIVTIDNIPRTMPPGSNCIGTVHYVHIISDFDTYLPTQVYSHGIMMHISIPNV
jgi:hypothetical protein